MGAKQSTRDRTLSSVDETSGSALEVDGPSASVSRAVPRGRTRSLGSVQNGGGHHAVALRFSAGLNPTDGGGDTDEASSPEESLVPASRFFQAASLPLHLFSWTEIRCPVCKKVIMSDDVECHLVMCLTKPRITYNEDVLPEDKEDECVICLDELKQGDTIARLPCLCIYHKGCIDNWFQVNRSCPEHPGE